LIEYIEEFWCCDSINVPVTQPKLVWSIELTQQHASSMLCPQSLSLGLVWNQGMLVLSPKSTEEQKRKRDNQANQMNYPIQIKIDRTINFKIKDFISKFRITSLQDQKVLFLTYLHSKLSSIPLSFSLYFLHFSIGSV
jgi:hypothetical protein